MIDEDAKIEGEASPPPELVAEEPRREPKGVAKEIQSLDWLLQFDEPDLFCRELEKLAAGRASGNRKWGLVENYARWLNRALEDANKPRS